MSNVKADKLKFKIVKADKLEFVSTGGGGTVLYLELYEALKTVKPGTEAISLACPEGDKLALFKNRIYSALGSKNAPPAPDGSQFRVNTLADKSGVAIRCVAIRCVAKGEVAPGRKAKGAETAK